MTKTTAAYFLCVLDRLLPAMVLSHVCVIKSGQTIDLGCNIYCQARAKDDSLSSQFNYSCLEEEKLIPSGWISPVSFMSNFFCQEAFALPTES